MKEYDFIIIGAGLAGLSAHHELLKKGYSVITLEEGSIAGGRVRTEKIGDGFSDTGAQFFTFNYPRILKLCHELNLKAHSSSSLMGQKEKDKDYLLETKNPLSGIISGLLSYRSWLVLVAHIAKFKLSVRNVHPEDPVALSRFDETDARTYCLKNLNKEILEKVIIPYFSAFNYAPPEELSSALVIRAFLHMASGKSLMGLSGGLATLPKKLASGKDIHYNTKVKEVSEGIVETDAGEFKGKHIIVATTASVAKELLGNTFPAILKIIYKPSVHEGFLVKRKKRSGAYGTLILSGKNPDINVLTDERAKAPGLASEVHDVLGALRTCAGAEKENIDDVYDLLDIKESEIIERNKTIWKEAIPLLSPGHFKVIQEYRKNMRQKPKILLAGDYLSTGCAEGAVESGQFIASLFP